MIEVGSQLNILNSPTRMGENWREAESRNNTKGREKHKNLTICFEWQSLDCIIFSLLRELPDFLYYPFQTLSVGYKGAERFNSKEQKPKL